MLVNCRNVVLSNSPTKKGKVNRIQSTDSFPRPITLPNNVGFSLGQIAPVCNNKHVEKGKESRYLLFVYGRYTLNNLSLFPRYCAM